MEKQLRIGIVDSLDEMRIRLRKLCCSLVADWKQLKADDDFFVEPLTGGITNRLYKCWTDGGFIAVVRVFGDKSDQVISRDSEGDAIRLLAERGFGKHVLAEFANGRIEGWVSGRAITIEEMRNITVSKAIARRLAVLHKQVIRTKIFNPMRSNFWSTIKDYAQKAAAVRFHRGSNKEFQLSTINIPMRVQQLDLLKTLLLLKAPSPIVFCHNDLLNGNIIIDDSEVAKYHIQFIDFEYSSYNHRAFDIANHFCELCGFECDWSQFPSPEFQESFALAYLKELNGKDVLVQEANALIKEVLPWVLASHLFWGFWAIIQASTSEIEFDYLDYAQKRFAGFDNYSTVIRTDSSFSNAGL